MKNMFGLLLALAVGLPACASAAAPADAYVVTQRYALGGPGGWDYLTWDAAAHRLFIARDNRVMVVDAGTGKLIAEIPGMQHAHGVALMPSLDRAYVTNGEGDTISVVDAGTLKIVGQIPVSGKDPDAIIFDRVSGHLLAMNGHSNNISVIDPTGAKELASIALPGNPEFAVSDGSGSVYVNLEDKSELAQIDTKTNTLKHTWPLTPCEGPTGLAFDAAAARLFSVCANGWMIVTDAHDGHQVARLAIGKRPDAVAYDPGTHRIFSASGEGVLDVLKQVDADHYVALKGPATQKSARTLALDPKTHQVFLVGAKTSGHGVPVSGFELLIARPR
jgi:YVTN family beta-propeller protein